MSGIVFTQLCPPNRHRHCTGDFGARPDIRAITDCCPFVNNHNTVHVQVPRGGEAGCAGGADIPGHRGHVLLANGRGHEVRHEDGAHGGGGHHAGEYPTYSVGKHEGRCFLSTTGSQLEWSPLCFVRWLMLLLYSE